MRNKKLIVLFSVLFAITLLIVLSSVIFSVQNVSAYCYNAKGEESSKQVLAANKIKKHSNIFMIKESEIINQVNLNVHNVRVINVEKIFPNKICINYIELKEYVKIYSEGCTYFCSNDGKILRKVDGEDSSDNAIILKIKGKLLSTTVGEDFKSSNPNDLILLTSVLDSLSRLGFYDTVIDLITKIDITSNVNIDLTTKTGLRWRIVGADYMLEKIKRAYEVYVMVGDGALTDEQKKSGMLILTGGTSPTCQYVEAHQTYLGGRK